MPKSLHKATIPRTNATKAYNPNASAPSERVRYTLPTRAISMLAPCNDESETNPLTTFVLIPGVILYRQLLLSRDSPDHPERRFLVPEVAVSLGEGEDSAPDRRRLGSRGAPSFRSSTS